MGPARVVGHGANARSDGAGIDNEKYWQATNVLLRRCPVIFDGDYLAMTGL